MCTSALPFRGWALLLDCDESRYCGWDCKHWLCHQADRQTFKETTALWFLCPCLLNQVWVVCACTHFFTHSTNKYCLTPEGGWLSEVPLERWLRGGVVGGSYGIRPNTGKSIPSYCKWSNYITVNLTLTFSASSTSALRPNLCNCGKLCQTEDSCCMPHCLQKTCMWEWAGKEDFRAEDWKWYLL